MAETVLILVAAGVAIAILIGISAVLILGAWFILSAACCVPVLGTRPETPDPSVEIWEEVTR